MVSILSAFIDFNIYIPILIDYYWCWTLANLKKILFNKMLGKKNQGNGYWNLSSTRGLVSKFFGDGSSEIEKIFSHRVTPSSRSKLHTGTGLPGQG